MADFSLTDTGDLTPAAAPRSSAKPVPPQLPHSTPGGLQPNPDAPPAAILPLAPAAQHAQEMGLFGGLSGNRALATYGEAQFKDDPSVIARRAQAGKAGDYADEIARKQSSGTQMLSSMQALTDRIHSIPEETWRASFGPDNTKVVPVKTTVGYYHPTAWSMPDMAPVESRYLYDKNPQNREAYDTYNNWKHLVEAATEGMLGTASKTAAGSDARMQIFQEMIDRTTGATDRANAIRIAHDAEDRIRKNSFLPARPGSVESPLPVKTKHDFAHVGVGQYAQLPDGNVVQKPYIMPATAVPNSGQIRALQTAYSDPAKRAQYVKLYGVAPEDQFMKKFGLTPESLRSKYLPNYQQAEPNLPQ